MEASTSDWIHLLVGLVGLTGVVATGEGIRKVFGWPGETTRKLIHIGVGLVVFSAPLFVSSRIPFLVLSLGFAIANYLAIRFSWLPGMHATQRKTYGTVFYPLAIAGLAWFFWNAHPDIFMISVLVLSIADPLAAWAGEKSSRPVRFNWCGDSKTVQGSVVMGIVTFAIVLLASVILDKGKGFSAPTVVNAAIVGWIAAIAEAMSLRGSDNLSIPAAVSAFLFFAQSVSPDVLSTIHIGAVFAAGVAWAAYRFQALTGAGAVAALLVGALIFGLGGWTMALLLLTFFVTSSLLSRWKNEKKNRAQQYAQKTERRDAIQVVANGGVACIVVIVAYVSGDPQWLPVFAAAVASANADTWATEIGTGFGQRPVDLLRWTDVDAGVSGGVTWIGVLGAFFGGLVVALVAYMTAPGIALSTVVWITVAALMATFVDSLMGSGFQAQFECTVCGRRTENSFHCSRTTRHCRGWRWLNNDVVNLASIAAGASVMWIVEF